jgi:hypothetical protein
LGFKTTVHKNFPSFQNCPINWATTEKGISHQPPSPQPSPIKGEGVIKSLLPRWEKARMRGSYDFSSILNNTVCYSSNKLYEVLLGKGRDIETCSRQGLLPLRGGAENLCFKENIVHQDRVFQDNGLQFGFSAGLGTAQGNLNFEG